MDPETVHCLHTIIKDDVYNDLKERFTRIGKGRRPDVETPPLTYRVLVQLWDIMLHNGFEQKKVLEWFEFLYPDHSFNGTDRLRHHMSTVYSKAINLTPTPSDVEIFLGTVWNSDYSTNSLMELKLTRSVLLNSNSFIRKGYNKVTNQIVVDLDSFRSSERQAASFTAKWLLILSGEEFHKKNLQKISDRISKLKVQKRKMDTDKKITQQMLKDFLMEEFSMFPSAISSPSPSAISSPSVSLACTCPSVGPRFSKFCEKCKTLSDEKDNLIAVLNSIQFEKKELEDKLSTVLLENKRLNEQFKEQELLLKEKRSKEQQWLRLKRKYKDSKEKSSSLLCKLKGVNGLCACLRNKVGQAKQQIRQLKREVLGLKDEITRLNALEDMKSGCRDVCLKSGEKNAYSDSVRKTVIALVCDERVSASNVSNVISVVAKGIFNYEFEEPLPSKKTVLNICDEANVLSHIQVIDNVLKSSDVTLHSDGTSRDHKKIVGHQFTLENGDQFFLGFTTVATEDSNTLLDITLNLFQKLSDCYSAFSSDSSDSIYRSILSKVSSIMTDRAASMKLFDKKFCDYLKSEIGSNVQVHFLHCNAHFLLGISSACEKALVSAEKNVVGSLGDRLGRDKDKRFSHFIESESATNRLIRTLCDILGPRGDQKNGCRTDWLTFCKGSLIPSYRSNRFNCFFQAAAAIVFHHSTLVTFFTSGILHENPNLKIQSVALDVQDQVLMTFICAIALLYLKITGPYWVLVNSKVKYVDFHKYVQMLVTFLEQCSCTPSLLFDSALTSVFGPDISFKTPTFDAVHALAMKSDKVLLEGIVVSLVKEIIEVSRRQLSDFLDDGSFAFEPDEETASMLKHCPLTNLIGESAFGDLDYDMSRRRNCSLFNRSTVHFVKRNKTVSYINNKSALEQQRLFSIARRLGPQQKQESKRQEEDVKDAIKEKFLQNQQKKIDKQLADISRNVKIREVVQSHGGPCKDSDDVDVLLMRLKDEKKSKRQTEEIFKNEIRFLNMISGKRCLKFGTYDFMIQSLKEFFNRDSLPH